MTEIQQITSTIRSLQNSRKGIYDLFVFYDMNENAVPSLRIEGQNILDKIEDCLSTLQNQLLETIENLPDLPESDKDTNDDIEEYYRSGRQVGDDYVD